MPDAHVSYDSIPGFGLLYDSVPAYAARRDVEFYLAEAERRGGSVLELGCGTGRILLPIARAGRAVAGLDGSAEMLARLREKLRGEPEEVRRRVTLHQGDVRGFDLGARFDLVIAPFRIIQHQVTIDDQLAFLDAVARHLAPGGRFVFDAFNPNFSALVAADGTEHDDTPERELPDGRRFRRTARVRRVRWIDQVSEVELIYYLADGPGAPWRRYVQAFEMRWFLRAELVHLLARAGFRVVSIDGDFGGEPLEDGSPELLVRAERA
ncbi:MAG: class I SAM-dependent methyltransferase [Longimicrobiaceae bacterium]